MRRLIAILYLSLAGCASSAGSRETLETLVQPTPHLQEGFWSRTEGEATFLHIRGDSIAFRTPNVPGNAFSIATRETMQRVHFTQRDGRIFMGWPTLVAVGTASHDELRIDWIPHTLGLEGTYRHIADGEVPSLFQALASLPEPSVEPPTGLGAEAEAMRREMEIIQQQANESIRER
jgi:hypothetical protein